MGHDDVERHGRHAGAARAVAVRRRGQRGGGRGAARGGRRAQDRRRSPGATATGSCSSPAASGSTSSACSPSRGSSGPALDGPAGRRGGLHRRGRRRAGAGLRAHVGGGRRRRLADQVRRPRHASGAPRRGGDRARWPASRTARSRRARHPRPAARRAAARAGCTGRGDAEGAPLWWPQGKVAGEYLPRWLTEHGVTPPGGRGARTRASRSTGRSASCAAPSSSTCTGSRASSAAPTRRSPRWAAACARRASAEPARPPTGGTIRSTSSVDTTPARQVPARPTTTTCVASCSTISDAARSRPAVLGEGQRRGGRELAGGDVRAARG